VTDAEIARPPDAPPTEFRSNAAYPLPQLKPVPDFVGLPSGRRYVTVQSKFLIAQFAAIGWMVVCIAVSLAFIDGLASLVSWPYALVLLTTVVYLPAYLAAFTCMALVLDDPPPLKIVRPNIPVTVVIPSCARRTELVAALAYLAAQDYDGSTRVLLVDTAASDDPEAVTEARRAALRLGIALDVVAAPGADAAAARNAALAQVTTELLVVVGAGVYLHPSAIRLGVARLLSSPTDTAAVSGHALIRNRNDGTFAEVLAADLTVQTNALQRVHGLFQGALVAEGSCSVLRTDAVRAVNGWPAGTALDVVLMWRFLERGWRVFHETLAIAFSTESVTLLTAARRRVRSTWGLLAAMHESSIGRLRFPFSRFLGATDAAVPAFDLVFTVGWVQAVVFLLFGQLSLVGWYVLLVLPLSLAAAALVRRYHREVLDEAGLTLPRRGVARASAVLGVQAVQAPLAVWAYLRELEWLRAAEGRDVTRLPRGRPVPRRT
jgi:biofilm PGA synthesis N-glycosyltransferase PgaC